MVVNIPYMDPMGNGKLVVWGSGGVGIIVLPLSSQYLSASGPKQTQATNRNHQTKPLAKMAELIKKTRELDEHRETSWLAKSLYP